VKGQNVAIPTTREERWVKCRRANTPSLTSSGRDITVLRGFRCEEKRTVGRSLSPEQPCGWRGDRVEGGSPPSHQPPPKEGAVGEGEAEYNGSLPLL